MVVNDSDRHEAEKELDRRIDLINVIFGAALGGYIGDVLGQQSLSGHRALILTLALVILVCLLVAVRNLAHLIRGTHKGSWQFPLGVCIGGIAFFYIIRGDTYLDLTALLPVVIGWAAAFAVVLSSHLFWVRNPR
ncbi:MAG TPA: hypothetical protein VFU80_07650 [Sphingomicrobium sp.]|nr:hypothetical protein [Sphingomicrobium sp.]